MIAPVRPMSRLAVALALALSLPVSPLQAADTVEREGGQPSVAAAQAQWKIWGGQMGFRWKRNWMGELGMQVRAAGGVSEPDALEYETLAIGEAAALDLSVGTGGSFNGFTGGALAAQGGFDLQTPNGLVLLRDFRLTPRKDDPFVLDLVGSDGVAWFYIDRMMYDVTGGAAAPTLQIRTMDLRISRALAEKLGRKELEGDFVADLKLVSRIHSSDGEASIFASPVANASTKWPGDPVPGVPGQTYQADVFMYSFSVDRADYSAGTTGPGGTGLVAFAPSSTLRNNRNNGTAQSTGPSGDPLSISQALYAADIVWNTKFAGQLPPYNNDQHPYLIWNLYRIEANGQVSQVGRSGVKHAFLTVNTNCDEYPGSSYILGRGCMDTYGVGNNDSTSDLGPRSEIIPATGQWGRCGSVYDRNCDGVSSGLPQCDDATCGSHGSTGSNSWFRMVVNEQDISATANPGATFLFESWYIVRDDIDIFNTMQTRPVTFSWNGSAWGNPSEGNPLMLGPAIDRIVPRDTNTATERSSDLDDQLGHARIVSRAFDLGGGNWRYDYYVMNFDFAVPQTSGSEPNLRVLSNDGFIGISVPVSVAANPTATDFNDGDRNAANDWTVSTAGGAVAWQVQTSGGNPVNALNWGTLYRFSFIASAPPVGGQITLSAPQVDNAKVIPTPPVSGSYVVGAIVPRPTIPEEDFVFGDGFE